MKTGEENKGRGIIQFCRRCKVQSKVRAIFFFTFVAHYHVIMAVPVPANEPPTSKLHVLAAIP
jgi:hypothetical protein